ncbi:MAG: UpxY family transcription antiterminator, partial [Bacteroidota bacterium]
PRYEKKVATSLERKGFEVYLPLKKVVRQWSDRRKKVQEPLFKSYVFICVDEANRQSALMTEGVVRYLYWCGKPAVVRGHEIEAIREFLGETEDIEEHKIEFLPGSEIEIKWGAFRGEKGECLARQGDYLILLIESLGQVIKAEIPVRYLL